METRMHTQGSKEDEERKRRRERGGKKECGDLFHPSAAFGTL